MPFPDATDVVRTREGDTWTRAGRPFHPVPTVRACEVEREAKRALLLELDDAFADALDADRESAGDHVVASFARGRLVVDVPTAGMPYRSASSDREAVRFALVPCLEGGSLASALLRARAGHAYDAALVATLGVQLAVGLSATPTLTRLTPGSILIDTSGRAAIRGPVLDAIARAIPSVTPTALAYTPPEQLRTDAKGDEPARLFSLGVMLHELLAGAPLFPDGASGPRAIARWSAPTLAHMPAAPHALRSALWMLLQRDPNRRGSARGLVELLAPHHAPSRDHATALLGESRVASPYFAP